MISPQKMHTRNLENSLSIHCKINLSMACGGLLGCQGLGKLMCSACLSERPELMMNKGMWELQEGGSGISPSLFHICVISFFSPSGSVVCVAHSLEHVNCTLCCLCCIWGCLNRIGGTGVGGSWIEVVLGMMARGGVFFLIVCSHLCSRREPIHIHLRGV